MPNSVLESSCNTRFIELKKDEVWKGPLEIT